MHILKNSNKLDHLLEFEFESYCPVRILRIVLHGRVMPSGGGCIEDTIELVSPLKPEFELTVCEVHSVSGQLMYCYPHT